MLDWPQIREWLKNNWFYLALGLILILAIFFRFWRLGQVPFGLHADEATNGLDAIGITQGDLRPFYPANNGREGLLFYLQAGFISLLGNTILALRLAVATVGTLAVGATYLFTKEWFENRTIGLLAAFIIASAPWAVTMSRLGFRAILMTLFIPLSGWLFTKAYKTDRWPWFVAAGVSLGLGFYTYVAYRFIIFVGLGLLVFTLVYYRENLLDSIKNLSIAAAATAVTLLPLGFYALNHPSQVLGTRSSVSFLNPAYNNHQPLRTLLGTIGETLLMFNFIGDGNYRHNLGGEPMLNAFIGIMFVFGLIVAIKNWRRFRYFALLLVFAIMLLPEVLTAEGIPHALRAIGVIPVVYVLAALGIYKFYQKWKDVFPTNLLAQRTALFVLGGLLVFATFANYQRYFVAYANAPEMFSAFHEAEVATAQYLGNNSTELHRYVVVGRHDEATIRYLAHGEDISYQQIQPGELAEVDLQLPAEIIYISDSVQLDPETLFDQPVAVETKTIHSEARSGVTLANVFIIQASDN